LPFFFRVVQRKNMMASHYSQKVTFENRVGLHYSHFSVFLQGALPENQRLTSRK